MEVTTIGVDMAKNVFAVRGADSGGRVVMRRQLKHVCRVHETLRCTPYGAWRHRSHLDDCGFSE
jgi:hypothetical protein